MAALRSRLTFSNAISVVALFVALGGTSYAAFKLSNGSVKGRHIAADAITSPKVKDWSLKAKDFAKGQLPAGPPGRTGLTGAPGTALGYALIVKCPSGQCTSTGGYMVDVANSSHVDNDNFNHSAMGIFCFDNNREFRGEAAVKLVSKSVVATVGRSSSPLFAQADSAHVGHPNVGSDCGGTAGGYGPNNAVVRTYDATGAAADPDSIFVVFN